MTKKKISIILIVLSIYTFLITFFHIAGLCCLPFADTTLPTKDYSNMMRLCVEKNPKLKDYPINRIACLGTHDSFSYNINMSSKPNTNEPDNLSNTPVLNVIGKGLMVRFARSQAHCVLEQLQRGVRFLDVRITYVDNTFYTSHGFISETLENSLLQVLEFLDKNPGEIIYFQIFHNFLGNGSIDLEREEFKRIKYNNKCIYDFVNYDIENELDFSNLTYNEATCNGNKGGIILFDRLNYKEGNYKEYFKLTPMLDRSGKNYHDINELKTNVEDHYNSLPELDKKLTVNNITLSPSSDRWWYFLTRPSLLRLAETINLNYLNDVDFNKYLTKMPIVSCDLATQNKGDFNIKINEKLIEYNRNLVEQI